MDNRTKEEVYDEEVFPLMGKIIDLCKRHKIAMLATYSLDDDLACTSALLDESHDPPGEYITALRLIMQQRSED